MKDMPTVMVVLIFIVIFAFIYANREEEKKENKGTLSEIKNIDVEEVKDFVKLKVDGDLKVYYLNVGQADSILIENAGSYMLIDAGNNSDGKNLVDYFKKKGITKFDYVIATHAHEDHIGGMDDVLNNFKVDHFYMPDVLTTTKTFEDVITALENNNISLEVPKIDEMFILGGVKFNVIHVGKEGDDLNDTSIVVRALYGDTSFLFMGDATSNVEKDILNKYLDSDVLKVGHHGSRYSSTTTFLNKVTPEYAVISVGDDNSYQHPHEEGLSRIKKSGAKIYRTDRDGTIVAVSDGKDVIFNFYETELDG